jgi:trimeric autotransporter adhesin
MDDHLINYKLLIKKSYAVKRNLFTLAITYILTSFAVNAFAQTVPNISYSPSTNVYTLNTAITPLSPNNSGGTVAALAYGAGVQLTGATLANPWGMGIDPSGNIYVVNYNAGNYSASSISTYSSAGVYQGTFGTNANLSQPTGITFDASGNAYVLNYNRTNSGLGNEHGNGYVDQYNSSGTYQSTIIQGLGIATGIASDASSNLYTAQGSYANDNSGLNTVSQYNTSGALAFSIATGHTSNPVAVAVDGSYNIYVLDNTNKNVTKYNSTGAYLSTLITGLNNPNAIYIDGAGDIYVGDSGTGKVTIYDPSGTLLTSISGLTDPRGIVTDSKGNLYVSDYTNNTVTKYAPVGGYFLSGTLPPGLSFNSTTGTFSGTPTSSFNATTYTITAYNAAGSGSTTVTLSCPPNTSIPSISYNPSINVLTIGTAASLSPINTGGTPSGYTISPTTLPAGLSFNTSTGIISGTPTTKTSATVFTVTASNASGSSSTTVSIACVVDNYWTGSKNSNDWNFGNNWSAHHVPTSTELASVGVINYIYSDPVVSTNTTAYYVTFGAANSAKLTVQSGSTFTISNILTINTNATPTFTGSGAINVASTAVVNVVGTGVLTISSPLTFTLLSDANSSASIAAMTSGLITGNVTVQRYLPGGTGYRGYILLSSPVNAGVTDSYGNTIYSINYLLNSTYVTGTNFTTTTFSKPGNPSLYLYRENLAPSNSSFITGNFRGISDLSASPYYSINNDGTGYDIPVGDGYLMFFRGGTGTVNPYTTSSVPAPATLSATGKLNQGAITFKSWYTPGTSGLLYTTTSGDPTIEGFNLVGNPYACTIDLATYATGGISMTNLSKFVYELNPISKTYGVYALDGSSGSTNNASRYIVSGQGFFVQASSGSPTPQLTFNESAKVENIQNIGSNLLLSKAPIANSIPQYLRLQMALDTVNADETIISFNSNAKSSYVFNEDAPYRAGTGKVTMSSLSSDNKIMAINNMPLASKGDTIRINVNAATNGTYSINVKSIKGIPQLYDIWLMDTYKNDSLDMRHNMTYRFDVNKADTASYGAYRFKLILRQNPALAYHLLNFTANKAIGKQVQVNWITEHEENYTRFTVERSTDGGKTFTILGGVPSAGEGAYGFLDKNPGENNLYRLKQEDINNNITYSHIIPVGFSNQSNNLADSNINVFPNPAINQVKMTVNTAINNNAASYHFTITNSYGLPIKQGTSNQATWETNVSDLLPGTYIIQIVNNKDKSFVGKSKLVKL